MSWRDDGDCRGVDTALFYPVESEPSELAAARAVCSGCPVREQCEAWGIAHEEYGVWGGLSAHRRRTIRRERGIRLSTPESIDRRTPSCGTHAGYNRHIARREEPCAPCRDAEARYSNPQQHRSQEPRTPSRHLIAARRRRLQLLELLREEEIEDGPTGRTSPDVGSGCVPGGDTDRAPAV